jgi:hypothetical protein
VKELTYECHILVSLLNILILSQRETYGAESFLEGAESFSQSTFSQTPCEYALRMSQTITPQQRMLSVSDSSFAD